MSLKFAFHEGQISSKPRCLISRKKSSYWFWSTHVKVFSLSITAFKLERAVLTYVTFPSPSSSFPPAHANHRDSEDDSCLLFPHSVTSQCLCRLTERCNSSEKTMPFRHTVTADLPNYGLRIASYSVSHLWPLQLQMWKVKLKQATNACFPQQLGYLVPLRQILWNG